MHRYRDDEQAALICQSAELWEAGIKGDFETVRRKGKTNSRWTQSGTALLTQAEKGTRCKLLEKKSFVKGGHAIRQ